MKKPPDPHLPLFNEALPTPKTSFNGAVPSSSHPSTLSAVIIAERWFQPQAFHTHLELFPKTALCLRLKDEIYLNVPQSRTDLSFSLPINGGNDSHYPFQLSVFHQIDASLPKLPFPLRISYSLQAVYLQSQTRAGDMRKESFRPLVGINCSNLYESTISEKIHKFSQDPSHKAMFIAALKYETTRLSPDSSPDHHDNIPVIAHTTQPRELLLLDGVRSYNNCQSDSTRNCPYVGALKFGVGGNSNSQVPILQPKLCPQFSRGNLIGILPLG
ncbi:hypothetical protein Cgig2_015424 [Carnegiea gigantea]|uniref:Uncharacterized protein n=1 Tax=Carnegiea gigantea TaxID=171969 RepID=A0A9Q1JXB8_9CARY|nr:hypothetical protein Cgig2_015424 [Carnegiea gigantea]